MRSWVAERTAPIVAPKTYAVANGFRLAAPSVSSIPIAKLKRKRVFVLHGNFHIPSLIVTPDFAQLRCIIEDRLDWIGNNLPVSAVASHFDRHFSLHFPDISQNLAHSVVNVSSDYVSEHRPHTDILAPELVPKSLIGPNLVTTHPTAIPGITPPIEFSLYPLESHFLLCDRITPPSIQNMPLSDASTVSRNRHKRIVPPSIRDLPLPAAANVSRNLYKPFSPVRIVGCRFETRTEPQEETAFGYTAMNVGFGAGTERHIRSRSLDGTYHTDQRQPPIWGYLLAFLKPPLQLDRLRASDLPGTLYPFQVEGVRRLVTNTAFLLADEMGTGKTVITSVARGFFSKEVAFIE